MIVFVISKQELYFSVISNCNALFQKEKCPKIYGQKVKIPTIWKVGKATYHTRTGINAGFFFIKKGRQSLFTIRKMSLTSFVQYSCQKVEHSNNLKGFRYFGRFRRIWPKTYGIFGSKTSNGKLPQFEKNEIISLYVKF